LSNLVWVRRYIQSIYARAYSNILADGESYIYYQI